MNLVEIRNALQEIKGKIEQDMVSSAFISKQLGAAPAKPELLDMKALTAIALLDDYLLFAIAQEELDKYSDDELEAMGRPHNLMGMLIENRQIKLTPTPGAKGADCLAYSDKAEENGCHICPWQKTCFPDGLPFKGTVNA